jgi:hypothetical protein
VCDFFLSHGFDDQAAALEEDEDGDSGNCATIHEAVARPDFAVKKSHFLMLCVCVCVCVYV